MPKTLWEMKVRKQGQSLQSLLILNIEHENQLIVNKDGSTTAEKYPMNPLKHSGVSKRRKTGLFFRNCLIHVFSKHTRLQHDVTLHCFERT